MQATAAVGIREGQPSDLDAMYRLDCVCFEPVFRFSRFAMRRFARAPGAFSLIVERESTVAAFVIVQLNDGAGKKAAYVVTLDVEPAWRRQGLARALLAEAESRARAAGAQVIALHVWTGNQGACTFYKGIGYEVLQLHADFYAPGINAYGMQKTLSMELACRS